VAVVFGHIDLTKFPIISSEAGPGHSKTATNAKGAKSGISYRPNHAYFQDLKLKLSKKSPETLTDYERTIVSLSWSSVKERPELRDPFDRLSEADRERATDKARLEEEEEARLHSVNEVHRCQGDSPDTFVVEAPLYEVIHHLFAACRCLSYR